MPGTFTPKVLAQGQLPNAAAALYTVPGSTWAYVKSFPICNTNAAVQTVDIFLNTGGTRRRVGRWSLAQWESAEIVAPGTQWVLEAGDSIDAVTTTASAVDYTIMGVEEV